MLSKDIKRVMKENEEFKKIFEKYDETREFGLDRVRKNFTIGRSSYLKLLQLSKERKQPMSRILDVAISQI